MEAKNKDMSVKKQCDLLGISRTAYYYKPQNKSEDKDISDLKLILTTLQEIPFYGYRKISKKLLNQPHIKVLKLIKELNFSIGRRLMAEVLRGEENNRIKKLKFHYKNNFGALGLYAAQDIFELLDIMISKNFIEGKTGVNNMEE